MGRLNIYLAPLEYKRSTAEYKWSTAEYKWSTAKYALLESRFFLLDSYLIYSIYIQFFSMIFSLHMILIILPSLSFSKIFDKTHFLCNRRVIYSVMSRVITHVISIPVLSLHLYVRDLLVLCIHFPLKQRSCVNTHIHLYLYKRMREGFINSGIFLIRYC